MKTKVKWNLVTGDPNLVTENEIYVAYDEDGYISYLAKRNSSGSLVPFLYGDELVDKAVEDAVDIALDSYVENKIENTKAYTRSIGALVAGQTYEFTPSEGKDAVKKITLTVTDEEV